MYYIGHQNKIYRMKQRLYEISIETEMDVVLAQQKTTCLGKLAGLSALEQTQMGTAVSEIARNTLEHAEQGHISFYLVAEDGQKPQVEIAITDAGNGMDPNASSANQTGHFLHKGNGISMSRKLVDHFRIDSSEQGTTVTLHKAIPNAVKLDAPLIQAWTQELDSAAGTQSPYEELKAKNQQLITLMQELEEKNEANHRQVGQIKELNTELDRKNQDLTEFAYTLSHDLKNPLSNILTLTAMAREAENNLVFLGKIEASAFIMDDIVKGLMQIIDVDQDASDNVKTLRFQPIIEKLTSEYTREMAASHASVHTDFQVESIRYGESYLNSIIRNLVSNAIKYQAEERPLELHLETHRQDNYVVLRVQDNGIGMDIKKYEQVLFKPFRRFTHQKTGKGIGLHLIKKMIEKNGGTITVESTIGKGTTFCCCLQEYD